MASSAKPGVPEAGETSVLDHVGFLLRRAQLLVFEDFGARLATLELGPSEYAMLALIRQHGRIRQGRVGDLLAIRSANLSPLVQRMVDRDLLERRRVEHDQRSVELLLTAAGERLARRASRRVEAHLTRVHTLLGDENQQALLASLRLLIGKLSA